MTTLDLALLHLVIAYAVIASIRFLQRVGHLHRWQRRSLLGVLTGAVTSGLWGLGYVPTNLLLWRWTTIAVVTQFVYDLAVNELHMNPQGRVR